MLTLLPFLQIIFAVLLTLITQYSLTFNIYCSIFLENVCWLFCFVILNSENCNDFLVISMFIKYLVNDFPLFSLGVGVTKSYLQIQVSTSFLGSIWSQELHSQKLPMAIISTWNFEKNSHVIHYFFSNFMQIKNFIMKNAVNECLKRTKMKCDTSLNHDLAKYIQLIGWFIPKINE